MARFSLLLLAAALAGCGGLQQQLGLERQAPDEFTVTQTSPLTVPPVFDLPPPGAAAAPAAATGGDAAAEILLGSPPGQAPETDAADAALLRLAGATAADAGVRARLDAENATAIRQKQPSLLDRLLGRKNTAPAEPLVNPAQESAPPADS